MTNTTKKLAKKKGIVVSDSMNKTIVVAVQTLKTHPKYLKKYRSTKNYKVHDEGNLHKKGETVEFTQCRPMSKDKSHIVIA